MIFPFVGEKKYRKNIFGWGENINIMLEQATRICQLYVQETSPEPGDKLQMALHGQISEYVSK